MAIRTVKFMGNAFNLAGDATLRVSIGGTEVFNGTVVTNNTAANQTLDPEVIATFPLDTSVTGDVPLVIEAVNGDIVFNELLANYVDQEYVVDASGNAILDEAGNYQVTVLPENHYGSMNWNSDGNDGKNNVVITGVNPEDYARNTTSNVEWSYLIPNGETLSCTYSIQKLRLEPYTPPTV